MYIAEIPSWKDTEAYLEFITELLASYKSLGPLPGILLPFIEAFLPFLPLVVFVFANIAAYGLLKGFLYSWIGSSVGSIAVFLLIRKFGHKKVLQKIKRNKQVTHVTGWIEKRGFGPIFLLLCFPFSPSAIINVVAGLSRINVFTFSLAVFMGKAVMIFSVSYIGSSILEFADNPMKTVYVCVGISLFWILGKIIETKMDKKSDKIKETED